MKIVIFKNLDFQTFQPASQKLVGDAKQVLLFGKLAGIYDKGEIIDSQNAFKKISQAIEVNKGIEELLNQSLGSFLILEKQKQFIKIYASPHGPGCFFVQRNGQLIINDNEKELYQEVKENGLNDFEVLHNLLNHPAVRSPFTSIFQRVNRMVGGQIMEIKKDLIISQKFYLPYHNYCGKKSSLALLYPKFKTLWEALNKNALRVYRRQENFVLLSGGIDSAIQVLAVKESGFPFRTLHWKKSRHLTNSVGIMAKKIGIKLEFIGDYLDTNPEKWWRPYLLRGKEVYRAGLGLLGIKNMFLEEVFFNPNHLFLSTHSIGMLYQGNPFSAPNFSRSYGKQLIKDFLKLQPQRFLFSESWRKIVAQRPWMAPLFNWITDKEHPHPKNSFEYLYSLLFYAKKPLIIENILPGELKALENPYRDYRERVVLKPVLGESIYNDLKSGKKISGQELGQLMRMLKFAVTTQSATLESAGYDRASGSHIVDTPIDGPMIDFLHKLPITLREVRHLKTLYFLYFRKMLDYDYFKDYLPDCSGKSFISEAWQRVRYGRIQKLAHTRLDVILASPQFKKHFVPEIDPNNSALLSMIQNPMLKNYIYNLYQEVQKGNYPAFFTISQILNMELFLKDIL